MINQASDPAPILRLPGLTGNVDRAGRQSFPKPLTYRPEIDGLRAIAVLPVLVYHAGLGLSGGFVGVDVFFVISGFLITALLLIEIEERRFSLWQFYERRARRLFPALFVMLAATSLAATLIMVPFDLKEFGASLVATVLFAGNLWFYAQEGYFTEAAELDPLLHTWSLGVEEQFYILFPVLLLVLVRGVGARGALAGILVLAAASFLAALAVRPVAPEAAFYLPHLRAWELLLGGSLALIRGQVRVDLPAWVSSGLGVLGLAAILVPMALYNAETPFPGHAALPPALGAALLIAVGGSLRMLSWRPVIFVGRLSYSLYLWHWPVLALAFYQLGPLSPGQGAACLALSFALAYLSWRWIETPFRRRASFHQVWASSGLGLLLTLSAGLALWRLDGLPGRLDPALLHLAEPRNFLHDRRDCHGVTPVRARAGDVCLRGAGGAAPSFILVGDSHADAISPAIFAAADARGMAGYQYTDAGFLPLPGTWRQGQAETDEAEAIIAFLKARPDLRTVIVARYWLHQITGASYRHAGDVWVDAAYHASGTAYNARATANGLRRLAARLPDRQIVLLDDVPSGAALHIRDQVRRVRLRDFSTLGLPAAEADGQRAHYAPVLAELAADVVNLHYSPVFETLCSATLCPLFDGETLLYRDGDHLSWQGALRLTAVAEVLLQSPPFGPREITAHLTAHSKEPPP